MYDRTDNTLNGFEWDPRKERLNHRKHRIWFSDAVTVFDDALAVTITERANGEHRLASIGIDATGRVLVVIWTPRGERWRVISARRDVARDGPLRANAMKKKYDFSNGVRGAAIPPAPGKTKITIRLDDAILDWFRGQANRVGGGSYQTMMNHALWEYIRGVDTKQIVREVVREELAGLASKQRKQRRLDRRSG